MIKFYTTLILYSLCSMLLKSYGQENSYQSSDIGGISGKYRSDNSDVAVLYSATKMPQALIVPSSRALDSIEVKLHGNNGGFDKKNFLDIAGNEQSPGIVAWTISGAKSINWSGPNIKSQSIEKYCHFCRYGENCRWNICEISTPESFLPEEDPASRTDYTYTPKILVPVPEEDTRYTANWSRNYTFTSYPGSNIPQYNEVFQNFKECPIYKFPKLQHFGKVAKGEKVIERMLATENFKLCADGSNASIFKLFSKNIDLTSVKLSIKEDRWQVDTLSYGKLTLIWQSPDSLIVNYRHPQKVNTTGSTSKITLVVSLDNIYGVPMLEEDYPITLFRSPVLLVHGLWSSDKSFEELQARLLSKNLYPSNVNLIRRLDYSATNNKSFAFNLPQVSAALDNIFASLQTAGIAAGKVDYVGHSMGGILGRLHLQSARYNDNLRSIITINTPHSGSQLANMILALSYTASLATCNYLLAAAVNNLGCNEGAIDDLCVDSYAIKIDLNGSSLNRHRVPSHAIATYEDVNPTTYVKTMLTKAPKTVGLFLLRDIATTLLFSGQNDWIVSVTSQLGGLPKSSTSIIEGQIHLGSPSNPNVLNKIEQLLEAGPTSSSFSSDGFKPAPLTAPIDLNPQRVLEQKSEMSLNVISPAKGTAVLSGSELNIKYLGVGLIRSGIVISHSEDSIFVAKTENADATFSLKIEPGWSGKRKITVFGETAAGTIVTDTSHFYINNTPLPIKFITFTAKSNKNQSVLEWEITENEELTYFEVQRSSDGKKFNPIEKKWKIGENTGTANYQYIDKRPILGNNYYRIRAVDYNSVERYTRIVSVNHRHNLQLYPNPADGELILNLSDRSAVYWRIKNLSGNGVIEGRISEYLPQKIALKGISPGVYFFELYNTQHKLMISEKFIKAL